MGSHNPDVDPRMMRESATSPESAGGSANPDRRSARRKVSAFAVLIVGFMLITAAAIPGVLRVQEAEEADAAEVAEAVDPDPARPGDPSEFAGWSDVNFPHDFHIDDLELDCADCHHETDAARLVMPHDDYFDDFWIDCTICHKSDGETSLDPQDCHDCHPSAPRNSGDETISAKVVIHRNCWDCHDSGIGADASESCSFCHDGPQ